MKLSPVLLIKKVLFGISWLFKFIPPNREHSNACFFAISVEEGAKTIIHLSTDDSVKNITGKYFYQSKIDEPSIFAQSQKDADLLWDISLRIVKNKGLTLT